MPEGPRLSVVVPAYNEAAVIGHVILEVEMRPKSLFTHELLIGHVTQIEVDANFRRRGYGRALLSDCERLAKVIGLRRLLLDVWAFNHSSRSFFEAAGFDGLNSQLTRVV